MMITTNGRQAMEFKYDDLTFSGGSEQVVTGNNPEYADYDNPRGDLYGFQPYVTVTDRSGNRKRLNVGPALGKFYCFGGDHSLKIADEVSSELATRLQARWDNFGKVPVRFCDWFDINPCYGSEAYIAYGQADEVEWERMIDRDDGLVYGRWGIM